LYNTLAQDLTQDIIKNHFDNIVLKTPRFRLNICITLLHKTLAENPCRKPLHKTLAENPCRKPLQKTLAENPCTKDVIERYFP